MTSIRTIARVAVVAVALATAAALPASPASAQTSTASWSTAATDTYNDSFNTGTVSFTTVLTDVTRLQLVTNGYGHSHTGTVTLAVNLLPSRTTVWTTTLASGGQAYMYLDVSFPAVAQVTGVEITSSPAQQQTYHGFAPNDTVTVTGIGPCSDGVDNDGDGAVDYPADTGCANADDTTEAPNPQCSDGLDNDADGRVDGADTGCTGPRDDSEGVSCTTSTGITACIGLSSGTPFKTVTVYGEDLPPGTVHRVAGYLDVFRFRLPNSTTVNVPCVLLYSDGTWQDPCGSAGGVDIARTATLLDRSVAQPDPHVGAPLASVALCNAELVTTVNDIGIASAPAFTLC